MRFIWFMVLCVVLLVSGSHAWLAPERCEQNSRSRRSQPINNLITLVPSRNTNISEVAYNQNARLKEIYRNHKFSSIPIRGGGNVSTVYTHTNYFEHHNDIGIFIGLTETFIKFEPYYTYAAYNCTFYTYDPSIIASVDCAEGVSCTLSRIVAAADTYTASEGYNWGVKISTKYTLIEKIFEIGGEASIGGTYSCAYTKGRTVSDTVSCTDASGKGRVLQLYNVHSDMQCQFGKIVLVPEKRDGGEPFDTTDSNFVTEEEKRKIRESSIVTLDGGFGWSLLLDVDKLPEEIFHKIIKRFPKYNPYTDIVSIRPWEWYSDMQVRYYKIARFEDTYRKIIPFTNENGDSIYQYACTLE